MNDDYSFLKNSRRQFIKGTGSMVALGSLPGYLSADENRLQDNLSELQKLHALVLYRENDGHSVAFADTLSQAGLQAIALTDDPVRQWRDGLMDAMTGVPVLGLSNWADYFVINGLAAEQRKFVLLELQHAVTQTQQPNWSASLALDYLNLPIKSDSASLQSRFLNSVQINAVSTGSRSLFSWIIG